MKYLWHFYSAYNNFPMNFFTQCPLNRSIGSLGSIQYDQKCQQDSKINKCVNKIVSNIKESTKIN